jgi:putative ABC transport system ATP-binding protein
MLKAVGLINRAKHKPSELSGGQQQRVSIARAFVNNPQVVFADEPTGNLDTKTTIEMMDLITGIANEHNQTLIIVTHDTEISQYADQIIHIRDGNIESITDNANKIMPGHHATVKKEEVEEDEEQLQLQEVQAV